MQNACNLRPAEYIREVTRREEEEDEEEISRHVFSNEPCVVAIGVSIAENEPPKVKCGIQNLHDRNISLSRHAQIWCEMERSRAGDDFLAAFNRRSASLVADGTVAVACPCCVLLAYVRILLGL